MTDQRILHTPRRGLIVIEKTADPHQTVEIAERTAFVTYHAAPVILRQGRCYLDLSTCLATWEEGDGTDDDPPPRGGSDVDDDPCGGGGGEPLKHLEAA